MNMHTHPVSQSTVKTCFKRDWWFWCRFLPNLLEYYICTNNHFTVKCFDKVIAGIMWCSFFWPTVWFYSYFSRVIVFLCADVFFFGFVFVTYCLHNQYMHLQLDMFWHAKRRRRVPDHRLNSLVETFAVCWLCADCSACHFLCQQSLHCWRRFRFIWLNSLHQTEF